MQEKPTDPPAWLCLLSEEIFRHCPFVPHPGFVNPEEGTMSRAALCHGKGLGFHQKHLVFTPALPLHNPTVLAKYF